MQAVLKAHSDALLIIIGGGPELPRLRKLSRKLNLDRAVIFRGSISADSEVRKAFFDAHVFCLPSRQEGFGIVFLEAMAAGLPIVAVRAGAVPEIVDHEQTGLLVPPGNARALAGALTNLLADEEARARMRSAAARKSREYDLDVVGRRFLTATRPILSNE
jgi:glycosyltransferase involved in cell wall biosynthesis